MVQLIKTKPIYLVLLPVFFVLHGFIDQFDAVPVKDAVLFTLVNIGTSLVFSVLCWLWLREWKKAFLFAFLMMTFQLFYGSVYDALEKIFPGGILLRYRFLLPLVLILFLLFGFWLRKTKIKLQGVTAYLNIVLILFIVLDLFRLVSVMNQPAANISTVPGEKFLACDTCKKPDIFLIVPDQYTGSLALNTEFGFDNSGFENALRQRGFFVPGKSFSNYNLTPYSIASTLNMSYLDLEPGRQSHHSVSYSYQVIRNSRALQFFKNNGYQFYNHSIFDIDDQPANQYGAFLPYGIKLISAQTFTQRIWSDFRNDVARGKFGLKKMQEKMLRRYLSFNNEMMDKTTAIASMKSDHPKFVYTHLMMPHHPYYFDRNGKPMPARKLAWARNSNADDYVEYLQYCNEKLLKLVDDILAASASPPVIMLLSDHGLRHPDKTKDDPNEFMNLAAVYLPGRQYERFYDSISNVNQFRVLLNSSFGQQLRVLKDSISNVWD